MPIPANQMSHEIEEDRKIQIIPGTEIMVDAGFPHIIKSGANRVLVPQPSTDPHDPLVRTPESLFYLLS